MPPLQAAAASQPVAPAPIAEPDEEPKALADADNPAIPKLQLQPEWLYGIMLAEMSAQRGGAAQAAETYLSLARTTKDPRLAAPARPSLPCLPADHHR